MTDISIYDVSVGVFLRGVTVLQDLIKKAQEHPDASQLPLATLASDMKPLGFHVQSVYNTAIISMRKLLQVDLEKWEDEDEATSMEQLISRIQTLLTTLNSMDPESFKGKEAAIVQLPSGKLTGKQFIFGFGMPSFFFHLQTVYAILRKEGVPLGKGDFMEPWSGRSWQLPES